MRTVQDLECEWWGVYDLEPSPKPTKQLHVTRPRDRRPRMQQNGVFCCKSHVEQRRTYGVATKPTKLVSKQQRQQRQRLVKLEETNKQGDVVACFGEVCGLRNFGYFKTFICLTVILIGFFDV